jgi:hypothetical protein
MNTSQFDITLGATAAFVALLCDSEDATITNRVVAMLQRCQATPCLSIGPFHASRGFLQSSHNVRCPRCALAYCEGLRSLESEILTVVHGQAVETTKPAPLDTAAVAVDLDGDLLESIARDKDTHPVTMCIDNAEVITKCDMDAIAGANLEKLDMTAYDIEVGPDARSFFGQHFVRLNELRLQTFGEIDTEAMLCAVATSIPKLTSLHLKFVGGVKRRGVSALMVTEPANISRLSNLRVLHLEMRSADDMMRVVKPASLARHSSLRTIEVARGLTAQHVLALAAGCMLLERALLGGDGVSDASVIELLITLKHLRELHLVDASHVSREIATLKLRRGVMSTNSSSSSLAVLVLNGIGHDRPLHDVDVVDSRLVAFADEARWPQLRSLTVVEESEGLLVETDANWLKDQSAHPFSGLLSSRNRLAAM